MERLEMIRYNDPDIPRKRKADAQAPRSTTEETLVLHLEDESEDGDEEEVEDENAVPMIENLNDGDLESSADSDHCDEDQQQGLSIVEAH